MREAVPRLPVLCKIRVFPAYEDTLRYCEQLVAAGADLLTVHARTRDEKRSRWGFIERLKRDLYPVPVVANGNVRRLEDAEACLQQTGADERLLSSAEFATLGCSLLFHTSISPSGSPTPCDGLHCI